MTVHDAKAPLRISDEEFRERRRRLLSAHLGGSDAAVIFGAQWVFYLTGFAFIATERPIALIFGADRAILLAPDLEREHAEHSSCVDEVMTYGEYPGAAHPMQAILPALRKVATTNCSRILSDSDGYPPRFGYQGPQLSQVLPDHRLVPCSETLWSMRLVKSPAEIVLLRESARWEDHVQACLRDAMADGRTELEVAAAASMRATSDMYAELGDRYEPRGYLMFPLVGNFRSQIGENSALPHAIGRNLTLRRGQVVGTSVHAWMWGYKAELERCMFLGSPSEHQERYFNLMLGAQDLALSLIRPGISCRDIDLAVLDYFAEMDITALWRHHVGHGLGMEIHERPFLDRGDGTELAEGMILAVEPGIYVPGFGGFRHSDSVLVTAGGCELLTGSARTLDANIID